MNDYPCILIVDDEPIGRETLGEMVMSEDYQLFYASNGFDALAMAAEVALDLILLDVMMPGLNGFEVCRKLKADPMQRHVPVILVTALDDRSDLVRGIDAGADDFLHKPVNSMELRARVRSMLRIKSQYDALQETLYLREKLANMIVHDMRTPLAAILALSELAQLEATDPVQMQEDLETIYSHALRLNIFVNDMLMLAKMRAGELVLNRSMVDIEALVDLVKQSHLVMARLKRIDIAVHWPVLDASEVFIDEALFQRVLDNLLSNALKFSPPGSEVIVQVSMSDVPSTGENQLKMSVIDRGPGIPPEFRETVFDQYTIVDIKQKDISQIGLGLAFCKMVVEAHGGRIYTESNKPHGAIFTIEL